MKSKDLINKIIDQTNNETINWIFIGKDSNKSILMSFINIIGDKYLILELHVNLNKNLSRISTYMQNNKHTDKISIKDVNSNNKVKYLVNKVLSSVYEYNDDEEFLEEYKILHPIYKNS